MAVRLRGTDTSGRAIYASDYMWGWWNRVCDDLGFRPTIVQGAWMSKVPGGGATDSAGYHDRGGCFDLRTWDRTQSEVAKVIRTLRALGAGAWVRDQRHGMDPHIHFVLGSDHDLAAGAARQWQAYLNGRDGLSGNGPDYHWRPDPLVTTPPPEETFMATDKAEEMLQRIIAQGEAAKRRDVHLREKIIKPLVELVGEHAGDAATRASVKRQADRIIAALDEDPE